MRRHTNKWAKVADGSEFSVTEQYAKVCVAEGAISIVIDGPRLRHVGTSWGGGTRLYRGDLPYQMPGTRLILGRFTTACRGTFDQTKSGILPAPSFMPTVNGAIVRGHTNAAKAENAANNYSVPP